MKRLRTVVISLPKLAFALVLLCLISPEHLSNATGHSYTGYYNLISDAYFGPGTTTPAASLTATATPTSTPQAPVGTFTTTPGPSAIPTAEDPRVDLTADLHWWYSSGPDLQVDMDVTGPPSSYAAPSKMRLSNGAGNSLDFEVPELPTGAHYGASCPLHACLPDNWLSSLPFTLTVDINDQVDESDETNNISVLYDPPFYPTSTSTLTPTRTPVPCAPVWQAAPSANGGGDFNSLNGLALVAPNDGWAVGQSRENYNYARTLMEHWDGTRWSIVPSPNPGTGVSNWLEDVAAVTSDDVWAVGHIGEWDLNSQVLILRWDGTAWSQMLVPILGELDSVAAASADDVWAVGYQIGSSNQALTIHWDGTAWSQVPVPYPITHALSDVAVSSANDVWAVGEGAVGDGLVLHWDGTQWRESLSFHDPYLSHSLTGVAAASANNVWVVGYTYADLNPEKTFVLHWDGAGWHEVNSADPPLLAYNRLYDIVALAPDDIWAVGTAGLLPYAQHWDGTQWSAISSPDLGASAGILYGVAAHGTDLWTVGYHAIQSVNGTLIARYRSPCVVPTAYPPQFTDVSEGSAFYPYVRCLACQQIVGGYDCGGPGEPCDPQHNSYYRPASHVSRGQLSKIVVLAISWHGQYSAEPFADLPLGSTFHDYVGRLHDLGYISGYRCGGPGEPCDAQNRPYFRPNAGSTRGQVSKIIAQAADINDPVPSDRQTFEDVHPESTFWVWIERLAAPARGAIQGYACGGPGEPCVPPGRPYFRPNALTTRGQVAKIVANSFFAGCNYP